MHRVNKTNEISLTCKALLALDLCQLQDSANICAGEFELTIGMVLLSQMTNNLGLCFVVCQDRDKISCKGNNSKIFVSEKRAKEKENENKKKKYVQMISDECRPVQLCVRPRTASSFNDCSSDNGKLGNGKYTRMLTNKASLLRPSMVVPRRLLIIASKVLIAIIE